MDPIILPALILALFAMGVNVVPGEVPAGIRVTTIVFACAVWAWFGVEMGRTHEVSRPVEPQVRITITAGVSDTTYIYQFENQ